MIGSWATFDFVISIIDIVIVIASFVVINKHCIKVIACTFIIHIIRVIIHNTISSSFVVGGIVIIPSWLKVDVGPGIIGALVWVLGVGLTIIERWVWELAPVWLPRPWGRAKVERGYQLFKKFRKCIWKWGR